MSDQVRSLLRRAKSDLLLRWGLRSDLHWTPPDGPARAGWAKSIYPSLAIEQPLVLAKLAAEAERICELGQSSRDWVFRELALYNPEMETFLVNGEPQNRALRLWLDFQDGFERAERRMQVMTQKESRRLCTRYQCKPAPGFFIADTELGPIVDTVKGLYHDHDFSGEDATPHIDWDMKLDERVAFILHIAVSRLPAKEPSFNEKGDLDDTTLRRPTRWACIFDLVSGQVTIVCDRGGADLRRATANAVARIVLGQEGPLTAIEAKAFDLSPLASLDALPVMEGLTEWRALEIRVRPRDLPLVEFSVTSPDDAWQDLQILTGQPRGQLGDFELDSIVMEALFQTGTGRTGRAEKGIPIEVLADGTFRNTPKGTRERELQRRLTAYLSKTA